MQHKIPAADLGAQGPAMLGAIEACVHCGFCLPACPTYEVLAEEMDSPRGRIFLMKEVLEGGLELEEAAPYVDRCLGCLACEPACPSGVEYGALLAPFRSMANERGNSSLWRRLIRSLVLKTLPYPARLRRALFFARLTGWARGLLPRSLGAMLELSPGRLPRSSGISEHVPAEGECRARVGLLLGCAQNVLAPGINEASVRVLSRNGVEVTAPAGQGCCGALSIHSGETRQARELAGSLFDVFDGDLDAVLTNAAGCGSGIKEYPALFRGSAREEAARRFSSRVEDISVFLDRIGPFPPPALERPLRAAYQDACHLSHAQGVKRQPRRLLELIPGLELVPVPDADSCCGSAGIYNIEQPDLAREIGDRKVNTLLETGADLVVSGNIGCMMQLQSRLREGGRKLPVLHTVEVLDLAYRGLLGNVRAGAGSGAQGVQSGD